MHRDISLNNLAYKRTVDSVYGVLVDFDLTVNVGQENKESTSKQRTGTKPYITRNLLEELPPKHMYRHDLESLLYVIVILTTIYHEGEIIRGSHPIKDWFYLRTANPTNNKSLFLSNPIPTPTLHFTRMRHWTGQLRILFDDGYRARSRYRQAVEDAILEPTLTPVAFKDETFNELVDVDKFAEILHRTAEA